MRALLQRVTSAAGPGRRRDVGSIGPGLVVLLGVGPDDDEAIADALARARRPSCASSATTRGGRTGRCSTSAARSSSSSQFTLFADTRRGRRPGFTGAAPPDLAERCYERFAAAVAHARRHGRDRRFGAEMAVELVNDGPFTIWLDTDDR